MIRKWLNYLVTAVVVALTAVIAFLRARNRQLDAELTRRENARREAIQAENRRRLEKLAQAAERNVTRREDAESSLSEGRRDYFQKNKR